MNTYVRCPITRKLLVWETNIRDHMEAIIETRLALDMMLLDKFGVNSKMASILARVK